MPTLFSMILLNALEIYELEPTTTTNINKFGISVHVPSPDPDHDNDFDSVVKQSDQQFDKQAFGEQSDQRRDAAEDVLCDSSGEEGEKQDLLREKNEQKKKDTHDTMVPTNIGRPLPSTMTKLQQGIRYTTAESLNVMYEIPQIRNELIKFGINDEEKKVTPVNAVKKIRGIDIKDTLDPKKFYVESKRRDPVVIQEFIDRMKNMIFPWFEISNSISIPPSCIIPALRQSEIVECLTREYAGMEHSHSDHEDRLMYECGEYKIQGKTIFVPGCAKGQDCITHTYSFKGRPIGAKGFITMQFMTEKQYNDLFQGSGAKPQQCLPCIHCKRIADLAWNIHIWATQDKIYIPSDMCLQSHRNLMDQKGGYKRIYFESPRAGEDTPYTGFLFPFLTPSISLLSEKVDTVHNKRYIDQSILKYVLPTPQTPQTPQTPHTPQTPSSQLNMNQLYISTPKQNHILYQQQNQIINAFHASTTNTPNQVREESFF
jgi:hypothetical protein